jgi:hypothetical protein
LLRSAEKIHEREAERRESKEAAAVKQWAKNTETAKEDGGTHFKDRNTKHPSISNFRFLSLPS